MPRVNAFLTGGIGNQLCGLAAAFVVAVERRTSLRFWLDHAAMHKQQGEPLVNDIRSFVLDPIEDKLPRKSKFVVRDRNYVLQRLEGRAIHELRIWGRKGWLPSTLTYERGIKNLGSSVGGLPLLQLDSVCSRDVALTAHTLGMPRPLQLASPSIGLESRLEELVAKRTLGIHFRRGDFRIWQSGSQMMADSWYLQQFELMEKSFDQVWVFSDEPEEAACVFGRIRGTRVEVVSDGSMSAAEEMWLLSRTHSLILSLSSYSWWAAFWASPESRIVSPHPTDWRLESWLRPIS